MKSDLECLVCLLKQALNTVKLVTRDKLVQREVINRVSDWIKEADLENSPADISTKVYKIVSEITGNKDPYKEIKKKTNEEALKFLPYLNKIMSRAENKLDAALHIAVAGNIIDLGIGHDYDLKRDVKQVIKTRFAINDISAFSQELKSGVRLLFLGDNSGEIVFDRILIEYLLSCDINIVYVVKSGPIINDALLEDAEIAGITKLVPVIETGSDDIGVNFRNTDNRFKKEYKNADIILAKGHGNFETLSNRSDNIYFLLKAKCNVVAAELEIKKGDIALSSAKLRNR